MSDLPQYVHQDTEMNLPSFPLTGGIPKYSLKGISSKIAQKAKAKDI